MSKLEDTGAFSSSGADTPDTRALIGLLEKLAPLLLQLQTQSFGRGAPFDPAGGLGSRLEQQAAVAFTEDIVLDAVRNLSAYLQKNASRYPGLESYASVVSEAKRALAARDYQGALALVFDAYRAITILRAIRPELPPIRQRGADEHGSASSVH